MLTPDGLRRRVLDAIPTWEKWHRVLRQVAVLLPTHGDIDAIAEALEMTSDSLEKLIKKNPDFEKFWRLTPLLVNTLYKKARGLY